jgi:hypothetical protein
MNIVFPDLQFIFQALQFIFPDLQLRILLEFLIIELLLKPVYVLAQQVTQSTPKILENFQLAWQRIMNLRQLLEIKANVTVPRFKRLIKCTQCFE